MRYQKKAALTAIGILCLMLAIASAALGQPATQTDKTQTESQPVPGEGSTRVADNSIDSPGNHSVQNNAAEKQEVKPAPAPIKRDLTKANVEVLKKEDPGLISRIVSATKGLVDQAFSWLGTRYVWGGLSAKGVDCSGLTKLLYQKEGVNLPRTAKQQFQAGKPVSRVSLLPGDLVFFNTRGPISHVGMYVGNGQFVHAANPKRGVRVDSLGSQYYNNRYAGARRYKDFS